MTLSINNVNIKKHFSNPVHLNHEVVTHLALSHIYDNILITSKIDGANSICKYNNKYNFEVELVGNDMYIIDILEPKLPGFKLLSNRLEYLSMLFKVKTIYTVNCYENIMNIMNELDQRILVCKHNELNLYIKPFFKLSIQSDKCKSFYESIQYVTYLHNDVPNDGWIFYITNINKGDEYYPIKIKPSNELTVDLQYKSNNWYCSNNDVPLDIKVLNLKNITIEDGKIYKLLASYNNNTVQYYVVSHRKDKIQPNRFKIFDDVTSLCKYPDCYDIYYSVHLYKTKQLNAYYNNKKPAIDNNITNLLIFIKQITINNIKSISSQLTNKYVLDIGCGSCSVGYALDKNIKYYGVDIDPFVLNKKFKPIDNIYKICGEYGNEQFHKKINNYLKCYELIILNNVLYYFVDDTFSTLLTNLKQHSKKKSTLYVLNIFCDDEYKFVFNNTFYMDIKNYTKCEEMSCFKFPWISDKEFYQPIISSDAVEKEFNKYGWLLKEKKSIKCPNELKIFEKYINLHKILIFEKI